MDLAKSVGRTFDVLNNKISELEEENARLKREIKRLKTSLSNATSKLNKKVFEEYEIIDFGCDDR